MRSLADFIIAVANLAESEGAAFRRGLFNLAGAVLVLMAAALFLVGGVALIVGGIFLLLSRPLGCGVAALVTAPVAMLIGLAVALGARWLIK